MLADRLHELVNSDALARTRMALVSPRLGRDGDLAAPALAGAAAAGAFGRLAAGERAWLDRVEARRARLADRGVGVDFMSVPPLWGRFLLRLARELAPGSALELGTAFGISTAFIAAGLELGGGGRLITLDASEEWGEIAAEGLTELALDGRVERRLGWIDDTLAPALAEAAPVNLAFVDAEHQAEPTVRYFDAMLPHLAPGAVVVFDDIAFNREMRSGWRTIRRHRGAARALDLGRMGAVSAAARP